MDAAALESLLDYCLGHLVTAGDFARAIQGRGSPLGKSGSNAWTAALTDADPAVQAYFEVAILARDPALGFFGEESAASRLSRYFQPRAETQICLDPINGTLLYQQGLDSWDILLSIVHRRRLRAVVSYMPARGRFYLATRERGALTGSRSRPRLAAMQPLRTRSGSRVCIGYEVPSVLAALAGSFRTLDLIADHRPGRTPDNLNELFTGGVDAFACSAGDLLDWGALAFVVAAAGGGACRLDGEPLDFFDAFDPEGRADMLITSSPAVRDEILERLAGPDVSRC